MKNYLPLATSSANFFLFQALDEKKYIYWNEHPDITIEIKENGYTPKSGLHLIDYLARNVIIKGTCLDIGTGETAIIAQCIKLLGADEVYAADIDTDALKHAGISSKISSQINWVHSDVFKTISPELKFDYIISNPPQLPSMEVEPAHDYGGFDGLLIIKEILLGSSKVLKQSGKLYLLVFDFLYDLSYSNRPSLKEFSSSLGFASTVVSSHTRSIRKDGKTFEKLDYIQKNFPGFRVSTNEAGDISHSLYIIEFSKAL